MGLCITRATGETLHIGDNIKVTVTRIAGKKAVLRIEAPKDVQILRDEAKAREPKQ